MLIVKRISSFIAMVLFAATCNVAVAQGGAVSVGQMISEANKAAISKVIKDLVASGVSVQDAVVAVISNDARATNSAVRVGVELEPTKASSLAAYVAKNYPEMASEIVGAACDEAPSECPAIAAATAREIPQEAAVITAAAISVVPDQAEAIIIAVTDEVVALSADEEDRSSRGFGGTDSIDKATYLAALRDDNSRVSEGDLPRSFTRSIWRGQASPN